MAGKQATHMKSGLPAVFWPVLIGLFILVFVAERLAVPNVDLPFGWRKMTYDVCTTQKDYNTASKHCKEICPKQFAPGTRGNGFPFTVDYSDCDSQGGRVNPLAAPLNLFTPLLIAGAVTGLVYIKRRSAKHD